MHSIATSKNENWYRLEQKSSCQHYNTDDFSDELDFYIVYRFIIANQTFLGGGLNSMSAFWFSKTTAGVTGILFHN